MHSSSGRRDGDCTLISWSMLLVIGANVVVFWSLAHAATEGSLGLGKLVMFAQSAVGTSMIAFGGLNWALDGSAAPVAAVLRLEAAMAPAGALLSGKRNPAGLPGREIRFRDLTFAYPGGAPVLEGFDLTIPAGSSLAIVGQNGAGNRSLWPSCCTDTTTTRNTGDQRRRRRSGRFRSRLPRRA